MQDVFGFLFFVLTTSTMRTKTLWKTDRNLNKQFPKQKLLKENIEFMF